MSANRLFGVKIIHATLVSLIVALSAVSSLFADNPYKVVYLFTGISTDGANPMGSLTLDGSALIGMTSAGGTSAYGTIFSYNTDGTGYQPIYSFGRGANGDQPHHGYPIVSGNTIYGTTLIGGSGNGNVYSIGTNGLNYTNLYSFSGTGTDGLQPHGVELALIGSTLYGMTSGMNGTASVTNGTIFSYNTASSTFTNLVSFTGSSGSYPGAQPHTGLLRSGTTLYGMTFLGGNGTNNGTIFSYDTANSTFKNLVSFTGTSGSYIGANPAGDLIQGPNNLLYGVTSAGGNATNSGTIFSYNPADGTLTTLYLFSGTDGSTPMGSLTLDGASLFGTTYAGGNNNDGVIFSYAIPENSSLALVCIGAVVLLFNSKSRKKLDVA
ncbi:MAG: choice-of-anchor tandem repeat GloVer-containing protein [Verrucomicrobiae bacterium]